MANTSKPFTHVPRPSLKRSYFDLSHSLKTSLDQGKLCPIACIEVLPGDKVRHHTGWKCIMSPMPAPVMHDINVRLYSFFTPSRLLTPNWERAIAGIVGYDADDTNPDEETPAREIPGIDYDWLSGISTSRAGANPFVAAAGRGTLWDYMGVPPIGAETYGLPSTDPFLTDFWMSELPFRGYQRIWDEWFRNEEFETTVQRLYNSYLPQSNSQDKTALLRLQNIGWEKDYFTSALRQPQRGPTVYIPGVNPSVPLDGSIANLAIARAVKRFLDVANRAGNRLKEHIFGHWGVNNRDERLQRTEFIAGSSAPLMISELLQTSSTDGTSPQANPAGHSLTMNFDHKWQHFFPEDGYYFVLMAVVPKPVYQEGIPKLFMRRDKYDFAFPEFANLPEESIGRYELFAPWLIDGAGANEDIGYTGRFNSYRWHRSHVTGVFRSSPFDSPSPAPSLDYWHMARDLSTEFGGSAPVLSGGIVTCRPTGRIYAINPQEHPNQSLWFDIAHGIIIRRSLPKHGIGKY